MHSEEHSSCHGSHYPTQSLPYCFHNAGFVLLKGPPRSGKTALLQLVGRLANQQVGSVPESLHFCVRMPLCCKIRDTVTTFTYECRLNTGADRVFARDLRQLFGHSSRHDVGRLVQVSDTRGVARFQHLWWVGCLKVLRCGGAPIYCSC